MKITPEKITKLEKNEIFVYGDNEKFVHGAGAALQALKFGAKHGVGNCLVGQTWGIPTKNELIQVLPLENIKEYVEFFIAFTQTNFGKKFNFLVTAIGTGLSGYSYEEIAPLFKNAMHLENIYLPKKFIEINEFKIRIKSSSGRFNIDYGW